jgi:hypothetical protein
MDYYKLLDTDLYKSILPQRFLYHHHSMNASKMLEWYFISGRTRGGPALKTSCLHSLCRTAGCGIWRSHLIWRPIAVPPTPPERGRLLQLLHRVATDGSTYPSLRKSLLCMSWKSIRTQVVKSFCNGCETFISSRSL